MTLSKLRTVVSTHWLRDQLGVGVKKAASNNLRILDTSYTSNKEIDSYREFYMQGHIPQSVFFDLHRCVDSTSFIPRNLPDENCFADYAQSLGIHDNTHIVAYDRFGPVSSYRIWWLFRTYGHKNISILDGGLRKWLVDGYEVTSEEPEVETSSFRVKFDSSLVRDFSAMTENIQTNQEQIMDARGQDEFYGTGEEENGGHIPGAKMLEFSSLFNEDKTIKSEEELEDLFAEAGIDLTKPVVGSCLLGMTACGLAAAANILGRENVPIYYGSWFEWRQRAPEELKLTLKD